MPNKSLPLRDLLKKLKRFGIIIEKDRGKGSETILRLPESGGSKRGEIYTVKNHGKGTEIYGPVIQAILRRFNIDPDDFWK